jgi:hypothetical protein
VSTSYNGWSASPDLATRPLSVAGEEFVPGVRDDADVWEVLNYVATQMHERVEPIVRDDWHQMDDWGYNFRLTTGDPNSLSNHSSGTAIDYNATRHPFGVPADENFTPAQIDEIHKIINVELEGLVEWGGDYRNTPDAMHFDIKGTKAQIAALAHKIRNGEVGDTMKQEDFERIRAIVKEEVAAGAGKSVWGHRIQVKKPDGSLVRKSASAILKETWQAIAKRSA